MPGFNIQGVEFETFASGPIPSTGRYNIYANTDGNLYLVNDAGVETLIGSGGVITADITADLAVGGIDAGDIVASGSDLQDFVTQLLSTTFFPTFTAPSFTLTENISNTLEIGTITNVTLSANFNRGAIVGDLVLGVWNSGVAQDFRAGTAIEYIINGTNTGTTPSLLVSNYQVVSGNQNWSATVNYNTGPQPLDSKGNNFSSPLSSGGLSDSTPNVNGVRRYFYGTETNTTVYTSSAEVRAATSSGLNPSNGTTFTINIPIGAEMVVFAYPETLQDVDSVTYVEGLGAEVKGVFNQTTVSVESANAFDSVNYKVYTYIPAVPFSATATYNVTI